ncbi:unnamed protein product [Lactuca virosa]|uniref:Non-specific lipid-transfer protein n=1 Tax=Lactuca virosa TaxID=75947 RepID=A0AAU9M3Q1_9ASTR|nr:unnamed protein product [Lactuca virosa]
MAIGGKATLALLLCVMVANVVEGEVVTCQMVVSSITPCVGYLTRGGTASPSCCSGVNYLNKAAATTPDRQTACKCLKQAANMLPGLNLDAAGSLPMKCGVYIPYEISPDTDCAT